MIDLRAVYALSKNRGADAHHRRPFFDGRLEVVAHAHREMPKRRRRYAFAEPAVAQLAKLHEPGSRLFLVLVPGWNQHQPRGAHRARVERCIEDSPRALRARTELRVFAGEIELDQHLRRATMRAGRGIQFLQQVDRIDGMNAGERHRGLFRLVRLQVADEMPPYLNVGRLADFLQGFLELVLAEIALACGPRGADVRGAEGLGNRDQADVRGVPAGAPCGGVDPGPDGLEVGSDGFHGG